MKMTFEALDEADEKPWFDGAEWCRDTSDVPKLSGPIMMTKAGLIVPDWPRLAAAYSAAGWRWCREMCEAVPEMETLEDWMKSGWPPTAARIMGEVEGMFWKLNWKSPTDYCQFGGIAVCKSFSGKRCLLLDWVLVEQWKRFSGFVENANFTVATP